MMSQGHGASYAVPDAFRLAFILRIVPIAQLQEQW